MNQLLSDPILSKAGIKIQKLLNIPICVECEAHIIPSRIFRHPRDKHQRPTNEATLTNTLRALGVPDLVVFPNPSLDLPAPYQGLRIMDDGHQCLHCAHCFVSERVLREHTKKEHFGKFYKERLVPYQILCRGNGKYFIPVKSINEIPTLMESHSGAPIHKQDPYVSPNPTNIIILGQTVANYTPEVLENAEEPRLAAAWLKFFGWPHHVDPYNLEELKALVAPPKKDYSGIYNSALSYFKACDQLVDTTPSVTLVKLNCAEKDESSTSHLPFGHLQTDQTVTGYYYTGARLLTFLLRVSKTYTPRTYSMPIPNGLQVLLDKLMANVNTPSKSLIHEIFMELWATDLQGGAGLLDTDPTLRLLCLLSIKKNHAFQEPRQVTRTIAALERLMRLTAIYEMHSYVNTCDNDLGQRFKWKEAWHRQMPWCTEREEGTTFSALRMYQHYGSSAAFLTRAVPYIFFTDQEKYSEILFQGKKLSIDHFRQMNASSEAQLRKAYHEVLMGLDVYWPLAKNIVDDPSNTDPGYSFLTEPRNKSWLPRSDQNPLVNGILKMPALRKKYLLFNEQTGVLEWNKLQLRSWLSSLSIVHGLIMFRVQLLAGAQARGTEVTALTFCNTSYLAGRGLYIVDNKVTTVVRYTKTSHTGHDRLIPHVLDAFTALILLQVLIVANPLARFSASLVFEEKEPIRLWSNHLFVNQDQLFQTSHLTTIINRFSVEAAGFELGTAHMRQAQAAFKKALLPHLGIGETETEIENLIALQMGNSRSTFSSIYGVTTHAIGTGDQDIFSLMLQIGTDWQAMLGSPPGGILYDHYNKAGCDQFQELVKSGNISNKRSAELYKLNVGAARQSTMAEEISSLNGKIGRLEALIKRQAEATTTILEKLTGEASEIATEVFNPQLVSQELPDIAPLGDHWIDALSFSYGTSSQQKAPTPKKLLSPKPAPVVPSPVDNAQHIPSKPLIHTTAPTERRRGKVRKISSSEKTYIQVPSQTVYSEFGQVLVPDTPEKVNEHQQIESKKRKREIINVDSEVIEIIDLDEPNCKAPLPSSFNKISESGIKTDDSSQEIFASNWSISPRANTLTDNAAISTRRTASEMQATPKPPRPYIGNPWPSSPAEFGSPISLFTSPPPTTLKRLWPGGELYQPVVKRQKSPPQEEKRSQATTPSLLTQLGTLLNKRNPAWSGHAQREAVIGALQLEKDMIVVNRTGSGKSIIATLPASLEDGITVVVVPLVSLELDWMRKLQEMNIPYERYEFGKRLAGKANLIIVTVEKIHGNVWVAAIQELGLSKLIFRVIFDEAHLPLISKDFRQSLKKLYNLRTSELQIITMSATIPKEAEKHVIQTFGLREPLIIRTDNVRPELEYILVRTRNDKMIDQAVTIHRSRVASYSEKDRTVIFTNVANGEVLSERLGCSFFRGSQSLTLDQRTGMLSSFRNGGEKIIVATNALGAGFDYPYVRTVIDLDATFNGVEAVQMYARAGRDGAHAQVYILVGTTSLTPTVKPADDIYGIWHLKRVKIEENSCIRLGLSLAVDGFGDMCRNQPTWQACSGCRGLRPTNAQKQIKAESHLPCHEDAVIKPFDNTEKTKLHLKTYFTKQLSVASKQRKDEIGEVQQFVDKARRYLEDYEVVCIVCRMFGELSEAHNLDLDCPFFTLGQKQLVLWKRNTQPAVKACFCCHVPSMSDAFHGPFKSPKDSSGCYRGQGDILVSAAWAIYHSRPTKQAAQRKFGIKKEWEKESSYCRWLQGESTSPVIPTRELQLFVWYCEEGSAL